MDSFKLHLSPFFLKCENSFPQLSPLKIPTLHLVDIQLQSYNHSYMTSPDKVNPALFVSISVKSSISINRCGLKYTTTDPQSLGLNLAADAKIMQPNRTDLIVNQQIISKVSLFAPKSHPDTQWRILFKFTFDTFFQYAFSKQNFHPP